MSEEEKALVEKFQNLYIKDFKGEPITSDDRLSYIECSLITNLIEKQQKEINNLKEIEQKMKEETSKADEVKVEEIGYCPQCPECCGYCEKRRRKYE